MRAQSDLWTSESCRACETCGPRDTYADLRGLGTCGACGACGTWELWDLWDWWDL